MSKQAIYLDERERELARRVCQYLINELGNNPTGALSKFAYSWTRLEIQALSLKFAEREME